MRGANTSQVKVLEVNIVIGTREKVDLTCADSGKDRK